MNATRAVTTSLLLVLAATAPAADRDTDGIDDAEDNCLEVANAAQCDTNADGLGNHCDADLDNNCIVNSFDLSIMRDQFGQAGTNDADLDCNGVVNSFDLSRMREAFGTRPGPSTLYHNCAAPCPDPTSKAVPMRWIPTPRTGQAIAATTQTTRSCPEGTTMEVVTQALTPGDAYTMWFGWFEHPEKCLFAPPQPDNPPPPAGTGLRCGFLDLYTPGTDGNFVYGDGLVATGMNDTFNAFVATGVDPKHAPFDPENECDSGRCKNAWAAWVTNDQDPGVLVNSTGAEYHSVLRNHGPADAAIQDQTTTHDGGCGGSAPPCINEQTSGATSELPLECQTVPLTPECLAMLVMPGAGALVFGQGEGSPDASTGVFMELSISALAPGDATTGIGLCSLNHYLIDNGNKILVATIDAEIDCLSVPNATAFATGTVTGVRNDDGNFQYLLDTGFAVTVADNNTEADVVQVNLPAWEGPLDDTWDGDQFDYASANAPGNALLGGCEGGWSTVVVDSEAGNFWVSE